MEISQTNCAFKRKKEKNKKRKKKEKKKKERKRDENRIHQGINFGLR
jgi:hypothetical protein